MFSANFEHPKVLGPSIPLTSMTWFYTQKCSVSSEDSNVAKNSLLPQKRVEHLSSIRTVFDAQVFHVPALTEDFGLRKTYPVQMFIRKAKFKRVFERV